MKLNNRGWGFRSMLILSAILIFFFSLAIYFIYLLYSSLSMDLRSESDYVDILQYEAIEDRLKLAGEDYLEEINQEFTEEVVIYIDDLVDADYIDYITDPNTDNLCEGYVSVKEEAVYPYINCDKYTTEGYKE